MSTILPLILFGLSAAVAQEAPPEAEAPAAEAPAAEEEAPTQKAPAEVEAPAEAEPPVLTPAEALGPYDTVADPPIPAPELAPEAPPPLPVIGAEGAAPVDLTAPPAGVAVPEGEDEGDVFLDKRTDSHGRRWRNGMPLLWIYSCAAGSATGAALGGIVSDTSSGDAVLGAQSGFYLGGGAGALGIALLHPDEITLDESMLVASSGILGGWAGATAGAALIPRDARYAGDRITAAGILGAAAGTAVGGLMRPRAPTARTMLVHDLSTFAGVQVGGGIADIAELGYIDDRQARMGLVGLGGVAFMGTSMALVSHDADLDPGVIGLNLGHGSWIGLWTPFLVSSDPDPWQVLGGMRVGLGAGYLAGVALSPHMDLNPKSTLLQVGGIAAGNAVGAGIPLALGYDEETRWIVGPMLAGGVAGQVAGLALAPQYQVEGSDALLMGTIEVWSLYQAMGWGAFASLADPDLDASQAAGMGLTIAGGGTIIATTLAPLADFSPAEAALVGSGGVWGTWYGAWGGHLAGLNTEQVWLTTLITGNAGLLAAGTVAGTAWDPGWRQVGLLDSAGLLGGTVGAMFGVIASPDLDTVATASLVGSTAGLVAGGFLARKVGPGDSERSHVLLVPLPRWNLPVRAQVSAAPWLDEEGGTGALVSLNVRERQDR